MVLMTGGQALVESLKVEGVSVIFGLPGVQLDWAFSALWEQREHITVYHTRHEQATAYMADGYARTTGRVGTCLVVPGPGLLNATAGLATAYACNSPVLCIAGQIQSDLIGRNRGVLHEIKNQLEMIGSVTKWAGRAMRPEEIPTLVREAFRQLTTGRRRPVEIEIPPDVLQATADVHILEPELPPAPPTADPDLVERAAQMLGRAERPLIFAGGGVLASDASPELKALAEMLQAPVVMTTNGRGALSDRHYLAQLPLAGSALTPAADVVVAVGTRFVQPATMPWGVKPHQTVIQLDIDQDEIGRNTKVDVGLLADAKQGLRQLLERVPRYNRARPSRREESEAVRRRVRETFDSLQPQADLAMAIRAELPEDGIFVTEVTQLGYWANQAFPVYRPRTFLTAGYQGTLGFGFTTAMGAKIGNPDKKVVSIAGDGGFAYQLAELSTLVRHGINLVTVVFNDNAFGNVRRIQQQQFGGRILASELTNPDFVKLAEAFGVAGIRARDAAELRWALREALSTEHPTLIEVPLGEVPSIWSVTLR
ncbi:MAG: thiamine pyrophosphate-binding protein [Chloroflexota bacterium]